MEIQEVILRQLKMELLQPFVTSYGTERHRHFILVEVRCEDGVSGWAECVSMSDPYYLEETLKTSWHILEDFLIPLLLKKTISHPDEVSEIFQPIRGNYMAKAALEGAVWDLYARRQQMPLAQALGGTKKRIDVGVSIGIEKDTDKLFRSIEKYLEEGYKRVKLKIQPGWDIEPIKRVRNQFTSLPLMADANSAYTLKDADHLAALDEYNLLMIEQPLAFDDIVDHAKLQAKLSTPICLDESIRSVEDARKAIKLGSCRVINVKIGRVGGLTEAKKIHDLCAAHEIPVWCGGMLESGVGRAHNIAITTLSNFTIPGDTSGSNRYWAEDIIQPEVIVKSGEILVPTEVGIGYKPNLQLIEQKTQVTKTYSKK